jgi:hypothetical protein
MGRAASGFSSHPRSSFADGRTESASGTGPFGVRTLRGAGREWSTSDFGIAVSADRAASACSPNPRTHSGSGPSSGSPVKNFAAMHPP